MADKKITELPVMTNPQPEDLLLVVDNPTGTPESKSLSIGTLLSNTNVTLANTGLMFVNGYTPPDSENGGNPILPNKMWTDGVYIYVSGANNSIRRVQLSTF